MKVIDFRFRPNTAEIFSEITNSAMFKSLCAAGEFMKAQCLAESVQALRSSVASLNGLCQSRTHGSVLFGGHLRRQSPGRCPMTQHIIKEDLLWSNCL
jgi:hypothetical protein